MGLLPAVVSDAADMREIDCLLPDDVRIAAVATRLAELARMPLVGPDGFPLSYGLVARCGGALDPAATLGEIHLPNPLRARLVPEFVAARADGAEPNDEEYPLADTAGVQITDERILLHDEGLELRADVRIDAVVHREIDEFARQDKRTECVGLLLGTVSVESHERVVHITAIAPAAEAESDRTTVKMTLEAWESVLRVRDEDFPHLRVLGWFHSHAGWGVFLSDADVFVQKRFFPHPNMVAYVLDPCIGRDGFFYWHEGILGLCPSYGLVGTPKQIDPKKRLHERGRLLARKIGTAAFIALFACGIYLGFARWHKPDALAHTGKHPVASVRPVHGRARNSHTDRIYVIAKRDNLWVVCNRVYDNGDLAPALARYNGIHDLSGLQVGQKIKLPAKEALEKRSR